jgi:hypothetical protein
MTRFALSFLAAAVLLSLSTAGCSNKGVEINKESSKVFDPKTDNPVAVGGGAGGAGDTGGGVNKGKKPAAK